MISLSVFKNLKVGIRAGLLGGQAVIIAGTIFVAAVSFLSFDRIETFLGKLLERDVQSTLIALEMNKAVSELTGMAASMAEIKTEEILRADASRMVEIQKSIKSDFKKLQGLVSETEGIKKTENLLTDTFMFLDNLVDAKKTALKLQREEKEMYVKIENAHTNVMAGTAPLVDENNFKLSMGLMGITKAPDMEAVTLKSRELVSGALKNYKASYTAQVDAYSVYSQLKELRILEDDALVTPIADKYSAALDHLIAAVDVLEAAGADVKKPKESIAFYKELKKTIFDLRRSILRQNKMLDSINKKAGDKAVQCAAEVNTEVEEIKAAMEKAKGNVVGDIASTKMTLIVVTLLSLILAGIIGEYYINRRVVRRLLDLVSIMRALANGEHHLTVRVDGKDELTEMARALQFFQGKIIENLKFQEDQAQAQEKIEAEKQKTLSEVADSFKASVSSIVQGILTSSQQLLVQSKMLNESASDTAERSSDATMASQEAAGNVETIASATEELSASISEISRQVGDSSKIIRSAVAESASTNEVVRSLSEAAQKVGDVVNMISAIAEQTNLLALNATIEAARAGEAGKGFAVVAAEVKELASQTKKATDEISAQVSEIQNTTVSAASAIANIVGRIESIDHISSSIASAIDEQRGATTEIARGIQEASQGTQDVSSNMKIVRESVSKSGEVASQMQVAITNLGKQAGELEQSVDGFVRRLAG